MSEHTPGPWMVQIKRDKDGVTSYSMLTHIDTAICVHKSDYWAEDYEPMTDEFGYYQPDQYMDCDPSKVANAHLIAAAPELLEDLDTMIAWHDEVIKALGPIPLPSPFGIDKFRSDVAKAKGETE